MLHLHRDLDRVNNAGMQFSDGTVSVWWERQSPADEKAVLRVAEAAALLGVSPWLLVQEIKGGHIPHKRIGRRLVFSRQRLLEWLETDEP